MLTRAIWLLMAASLSTFSQAASPPPNILLLVAEDLSPRIGAYDDALARTPNLDQLASRATRYTRVFTTAGVCAPSRAALISGQYQISFGAQHMRSSTGPLGPYLAQPPAELRAFPELLRRQGYFTYTDNKLDYQFSGIRAGSGPFTLWDLEGAADDAWRQRPPGQPFFGLINFLETHESGIMHPTNTPHSPTHAATQQMRKGLVQLPSPPTDPAAVTIPPYYPDLPAVRADIARHYDNIAAMDTRVGEILDALGDDGLLDNTIVIWTTDHGDGLPRAKRELLDSGIHVPMLIRHPRGQPGVDDRLISFVDLAPTILRYAGLQPPAYLHGLAIQTRQPRRYVFAARDRIDEVADRQRAVRDQRYKYIRSWYPQVAGGHALAYRDNLDMVRAWRQAFTAGQLTAHQRRWFEPAGERQLYDTKLDPFELHNLVDDPAYAAIAARLDTALLDWLKAVGDLSEASEAHMRSSFLDNDALPQTPAPEFTVEAGQLHLRSPIGASIGYRAQGEAWQLYVRPLPVQPLQAKSIRYGWQTSEVVIFAGQADAN